MSEKKIILVGGGGHCRSCIDVIEKNGEYTIKGIVEQPGKNQTQTIFNYPVIGSDNDLAALKTHCDYALITVGQIGTSSTRKNLYNRVKKAGFVLPVIISPLAHVSKHSRLGEGTIVMHKAMVNAGARIGKNCILNSGCLIEHDVRVGDNTHISTAAVLNGASVIGSGSFVGSNATVVHGAHLPDHYFFKAASLITDKESGRAIGTHPL